MDRSFRLAAVNVAEFSGLKARSGIISMSCRARISRIPEGKYMMNDVSNRLEVCFLMPRGRKQRNDGVNGGRVEGGNKETRIGLFL